MEKIFCCINKILSSFTITRYIGPRFYLVYDALGHSFNKNFRIMENFLIPYKMDIIKSCQVLPSPDINVNSNCLDLFGQDFILVKILGQPSSFGIVYQVKNHAHAQFALKVTAFVPTTIHELQVNCQISTTILDPTYSLSFIRLHEWFVCTQPPPQWRLRQPPRIYSTIWEQRLLYYLMELADGTLESLQIPLNEYDIKCMMFELLYALAVGRKLLSFSHNDIKADNILIKTSPSKRIYTLNGAKYICNTPYLPLFGDFGLSKTNNDPDINTDDIFDLYATIANFIEEYDLDENFVHELNDFFGIEVDSHRSNYSTILNLLTSPFFYQLTTDRGTLSNTVVITPLF